MAKIIYPKISTATWVGFAIFLIVVLVLYNTKAKPVAILLVAIVGIGIILRFGPEVIAQLSNVNKSV
jgi:hypothetical protein